MWGERCGERERRENRQDRREMWGEIGGSRDRRERCGIVSDL